MRITAEAICCTRETSSGIVVDKPFELEKSINDSRTPSSMHPTVWCRPACARELWRGRHAHSHTPLTSFGAHRRAGGIRREMPRAVLSLRMVHTQRTADQIRRDFFDRLFGIFLARSARSRSRRRRPGRACAVCPMHRARGVTRGPTNTLSHRTAPLSHARRPTFIASTRHMVGCACRCDPHTRAAH